MLMLRLLVLGVVLVSGFTHEIQQPAFHSDYNVIVYFPGVSIGSAAKLSNIAHNVKLMRETQYYKQFSAIETKNVTTTTSVEMKSSTTSVVTTATTVSRENNYNASRVVPHTDVVHASFDKKWLEFRNITLDSGLNVTTNVTMTTTTHITTETTVITAYEIHSVEAPLSCLISFYDPDISYSSRKAMNDFATSIGCEYQLYPDAGYADHIKALHPSLVKAAGYTHAMLLLDDVIFDSNFSLARLLHLMRLNKLSVASPAIKYANVGATKLQLQFGEAYRIGKLVTALEIFATTFTSSAWEIFHGYVNPYFNTRGYLYERFFYYYALARNRKFHMGVVHDMTALHSHNPSAPSSSPGAGGVSAAALNTLGSNRPRSTTITRNQPSPRAPKHFVDQSSFHDKYLKNATSSIDCRLLPPKCLHAVSASYKNKYNYHWDWVHYNKVNTRDKPCAGRTGGPHDGARARLDMIQ